MKRVIMDVFPTLCKLLLEAGKMQVKRTRITLEC